MKSFKNVKSIEAKVTFHGKGIINADNGESHSWFLYNKGLYATNNKNIKFAKKVFIDVYDEKESEWKTRFKYKVSSDCIRHAMFEKEMAFYNDALMDVPTAFYNSLATPALVARGYMFAKTNKGESKGWSAKKKSVYLMSSAIAEMNPADKVYAEFCSKAGSKKSKDETDADAKSDTTLHAIESVGEYDYVSNMSIDLCEAQFISMDNLFDRCAVPFERHGVEYKKVYFDALKRNFNTEENFEIKNYCMSTSVMGDEFAEEGVKLTKEMVNTLVHTILERVANLRIGRPSNGGYMEFSKMTVRVNMDNGEFEEFEVVDANDIKDIVFDYYDCYVEADAKKVARRKQIMETLKEEESKTKKSKADKKENAE